MATASDESVSDARSYPVPDNETERVRVLRSYGILDSDPESDFERLTEVASRYFDVPIALVSLIDDERQWFKSVRGLDQRQTDRSIAFCNYAITDPDPLVIEDATEDERVNDNPLVTGEEGVRFYAGMPLVNEEGYALGTFCILDREPGTMDDEDLDLLEIFAAEAMAQLEKRRREIQLQEALDEKELLLEELHHRVKNNLQVIQSLLRMQARQFDNPEVREAFQQAQNRVKSLAMVHERIQEMFKTSGRVETEKYVRELLHSLIPGHGQGDVSLRLDVGDFTIDQDMIGQIGLILNELVHNSIEHGFPNGRAGTVEVRMERDGDEIHLLILDDGVGFPEESDYEEGLGTTLVTALVESKMDGTIERENRSDGGARVSIRFPHDR